MFSMDYFVEDSLKLQDMIDNDIRSGESYFNEFGDDLYCSQGLSMDGFDSTLDSEMSADGRSGWMNTHLLNSSADLDCLNGVLVNPRTALPNTVSDAPDSPISMSPSSLDDDGAISGSIEDKDSRTSEGVKTSLPMQVISSNSLSSENPEINAISVPTPSPSPSSQSQLFLPLENEMENADSPKLKSKSKSSKSSLNNSTDNTYPKPAYSYSCLIAMALKNSKTGSLPVNEIYDFMTENFPYFKTAPNGWKNSVRHNLSLNKCFEKIEKPAGNNSQRKGYLWAMNPAKIEKMEEELHKWGSKDPAAIRKSMANPERLELIEKGELRSTDSESELENMNVSQVEDEEEYIRDERDCKATVPVASIGNDLLQGEFANITDSVNIDACLPELDMQKGLWDNMYEDRMQHCFLNDDSPIRPLSPKNSETMEEEVSLESVPSSQRSFAQANYVYKMTSRVTLQSHSVGSNKNKVCNV